MIEAKQFKTLNGNVMYRVEGLPDMTEDDFRKTTGIRISGSISPDEQRKIYVDQSILNGTQAALDNNLDPDSEEVMMKILERADKDAASLMGDVVEEPKQFAQAKTKVSLRDAQKAELKDQIIGQRMAGKEFQPLLEKAMQPWARRDPKKEQGLQVGRTVKGFERAANNLADDIWEASGSPVDTQSIKNEMIGRLGYGRIEAEQQIKAIQEDGNRTLKAISIGIPNASADEGIARALMSASGIGQVEDWAKGDPHWSTDIMAQIGSGPRKGIDAQRRASDNLKLGILMNMRGRTAADARNELNSLTNENTKFGRLLQAINSPNMSEDKFLHTLLYNSNPSPRIRNEFENIRKDFIISADMRGIRRPRIDDEVFASRHGAYNPTAGNDYQMIDLNMMRDELLNTKMSELKTKGYRFDTQQIRGKGSLHMFVPNQEIIRFSNNNLLDREIINEITKRRIRR
jgi:hypothetical protein